jgi:hypothetical protein
MLAVLIAAAVLGQEPSGFTDEDIKAMNRQWAKIAAERQRGEPVDRRVTPKTTTKTTTARPAGQSLRGLRPTYNRPRPMIFWNPPRMMPAMYTVPPFIRR